MKRTSRRSLAVLLLPVVTALLCLAVFEGAARLVLGPPAVIYFTPAYRDVQTDFDVTYKAAPTGNRASCEANQGKGAPLVVVGDSFAFGQGVEQGRDFTSLLGCGSGREVLNLGSIGQDFLYYDSAIHQLVPSDSSVIVLLLYENDLPPSGFSGAAWAVKRALYRNSHGVLMARRARQEAAKLLHRDDIAALTVDGRLNNPKTVAVTNPGFFSELADPPADRLAELGGAIARFVAHARRAAPHSRIMVAMAPEASTVSPGHRDFYLSLASVPLPAFGQRSAIYRAAAEACGRIADCRFMDIFPDFLKDGPDLYFPHDFHWNAAGHARMADLLGKALAAPR
ncbi:MAG: SGNH/GDSL hydrolase family protein [Rhodospirillaceae bacterium]|nr:SGNH/GDSL hydrolase family protein [Rhodospirillales bacterium]